MRAILFDLDGTLLDIDIDAFMRRYFAALSDTVAGLVSDPAHLELAMDGVMHSTNKMMMAHPGETNEKVFYESYAEHTGLDLRDHEEVFTRFYEERFPALGADLGPHAGAHEAFSAAEECGLKAAVATNPIFPIRAIEHRMSWAGIDRDRPCAVTSFEIMTAAKPHPEYFRETARMVGVSPSECLMVGDDPVLDMSAADVGMKTFYVGGDAGVNADYSGTLVDLAELIRRTC
jgi:FMN phosphatase YigB (HAD superfamily)